VHVNHPFEGKRAGRYFSFSGLKIELFYGKARWHNSGPAVNGTTLAFPDT
jgi:hypothetical protein